MELTEKQLAFLQYKRWKDFVNIMHYDNTESIYKYVRAMDELLGVNFDANEFFDEVRNPEKCLTI